MELRDAKLRPLGAISLHFLVIYLWILTIKNRQSENTRQMMQVIRNNGLNLLSVFCYETRASLVTSKIGLIYFCGYLAPTLLHFLVI